MAGVVGDIDFYPNGGVASMTGCEGEGVAIYCSHVRAVSYMIESITSEIGFLAFKCRSMEDFEAGLCNDAETTLMGEPIDPTMQGTFYLRTNPQAPYAMPYKSSSTNITKSPTMHLVCLIF